MSGKLILHAPYHSPQTSYSALSKERLALLKIRYPTSDIPCNEPPSSSDFDLEDEEYAEDFDEFDPFDDLPLDETS